MASFMVGNFLFKISVALLAYLEMNKALYSYFLICFLNVGLKEDSTFKVQFFQLSKFTLSTETLRNFKHKHLKKKEDSKQCWNEENLEHKTLKGFFIVRKCKVLGSLGCHGGENIKKSGDPLSNIGDFCELRGDRII